MTRTVTRSPQLGLRIGDTHDLLRLNNNEGSWLTDDEARLYSQATPGIVRHYPSARDLEEMIARRYGVAPDCVMVTAGADDAIDRCFRVLLGLDDELILTIPTFQQFHRFAASTSAVVREVSWGDVFPLDDILAAIGPRTRMVAYATPNNPTGSVADGDDLRSLSTALPDGWVMLDHAYVEYADEDLTRAAAALSNVLVIRTFSKAWGMAGCRIGYVIASTDGIRRIRSVGNPYPVSALSLHLMMRRYEEGDNQMRAHVARIRDEREQLIALLEDWGVQVPHSQGNFLFPLFGTRTPFIWKGLRRCGVLVRFFEERTDLQHGLRISLPGDATAFERLSSTLQLILDPEAILFDMDGVLADTTQSYTRCTIETARHFGATVTEADVHAVVGEGDANSDWVVVQRILSRQGIEVGLDEITDHFQMLYWGSRSAGQRDALANPTSSTATSSTDLADATSDDAKSEQATPGSGYYLLETALTSAAELRSLLGAKRMGIVTGRPRDEAELFLERFGLTDLVDAMVCMEDGPIKPDPAPVLRAMRELGVTRAWMVGDTPDDIDAAAAAGVLPIGLTRDGDARHEALLRAGAAAVVSDLVSLEKLLR